jgi:phosphohistidine phosphatase
MRRAIVTRSETQMRTLWLLRHAESSSSDAGLPDRDRPLNARGRDAATRIGRHLAERGRPDLVLCSSALRARQTLALVAEAQRAELDVELESDLYLASEGALLRRLARLPDTAMSALLVGHNPGIGALAAQLAVRGGSDARAELRRKYPTGALAELRLDSQHWRDLARGCELVAFATPKHLHP